MLRATFQLLKNIQKRQCGTKPCIDPGHQYYMMYSVGVWIETPKWWRAIGRRKEWRRWAYDWQEGWWEYATREEMVALVLEERFGDARR